MQGIGVVVSTFPRPALKTRTHAITFRLGEREYDELVKAVAARGTRSISEFTRAAVMNKVLAEQMSRFLEDELDTLGNRLEAFDTTLRELRRHIRHLVSMAAPGSV
jgi:hypothetical protein